MACREPSKLMWPPNHSKEFPTFVKSESVRDKNKETHGASHLTMEVQNHIPTTPDNPNNVTFIHLFGFSHLLKYSMMNCLPRAQFWFSLVHSVTNIMKSFIFPTPKRQIWNCNWKPRKKLYQYVYPVTEQCSCFNVKQEPVILQNRGRHYCSQKLKMWNFLPFLSDRVNIFPCQIRKVTQNKDIEEI